MTSYYTATASVVAPTPVRPLPPSQSQTPAQTLTFVLRRANAYYSQLAAFMRASRRPTGHARKRAAALKLTVDTENARNLDHKQVSVIPLPMLDLVPSPTAPQPLSRSVVGRERELKRTTTRPMLCCSIPEGVVDKQESSALSSVSVYSTVSLSSPEVAVGSQTTIAAPVVPRGQDVPWRPFTSRWSMSTDEGGVEEEQGVVYSSDYEEGMDLPTSAEEHDNVFEEKPVVNIGRLAPQLDVPVDVSRFSWGSALISDSGSSSSSSSSGPITPAEDIPRVVIRIKRKSVEPDFDMNDETLEKRPKYERKTWVNNRRGTQKTTPAARKY